MNKFFSFLLISLLISNIICGAGDYGDACNGSACTDDTTQECSNENKCVCKKGYKENANANGCDQITAGAYGGACNDGACTDTTTQECSSGYCVCKSNYVEKLDESGCEEPAGYGKDCSAKACDSSQTCDSNNKCVCASGYKENSDKSGCEKDTTTTTTEKSNSSFIKNSLMILLGISIF